MIAAPTEPPNAPPKMAPSLGDEREEVPVVDGTAEPDNMNETVAVLIPALVDKNVEGRTIETM